MSERLIDLEETTTQTGEATWRLKPHTETDTLCLWCFHKHYEIKKIVFRVEKTERSVNLQSLGTSTSRPPLHQQPDKN